MDHGIVFVSLRQGCAKRSNHEPEKEVQPELEKSEGSAAFTSV
jgi:hypothetical protein